MSDLQCGVCGRQMPIRESSVVRIDTDGRPFSVPLCHPDEGFDCYRLVTVYHVPANGSGVFNRLPRAAVSSAKGAES